MPEDYMAPHGAYFSKKELEDKHADMVTTSKLILDAMDNDEEVTLFRLLLLPQHSQSA